jgi:hypothetical protein
MPGDDPLALQSGEPCLHGAARDAEHPRVLSHARLRLLEQKVQQFEIELIHMHRAEPPHVKPTPKDIGPLAQ